MPLGPVFLQASGSSRIRFPAPLGSTGISRFIATTGALTPHGVRSSLDARSDRSVHGVSLILSHRLPAILSSTISVRSGDRPDASRSFLPRQTSPRLPRARPRLCRPNQVHVETFHGPSCYGLAVLVPLPSTLCCHNAVTVRYLTATHRKEGDFHPSVCVPSQAHGWRRPRRRSRAFLRAMRTSPPRSSGAEAVSWTGCTRWTGCLAGLSCSGPSCESCH